MTTKRILQFLLAITLMAFLASAAYATGGGKGWSKDRVPPIWSIFKDGTAKSINWRTHKPNPRFAIYNAGTRYDTTDDVVWDGETGLLWQRVPATNQLSWYDAVRVCRFRSAAGRFGFHLPAIEELSTLIDSDQRYQMPALPPGHPFEISTGGYWTSTTDVNFGSAYFVDFMSTGTPQIPSARPKGALQLYWCVRGGLQSDIGVKTVP